MTTLPGGLDLLEPVSAADNVLESEPISSTVETGTPKDRKMSASTSLQPSKDMTEDPGEGDKEDWDEEDFILPIEYFVEECKLPSHGIHPAELPKNLVSDEQLVSCFGPKAGKDGRNGHRWDLSKQIPPADILSLVQVIDGHDKPINGTIGVIFPRALYAERILETTPMLEVDAAEAKDKGKLTELQLRGMPAEKSEASGSASPTVCSELSGDPKSFGASPMKSVQIESIEVLKLEIKQQQEKKHSIEDSLSKARDKISALRKPLIIPRELRRIEVERLDQLEREGEDLTVQMAEVLDAIAASESKEKNLREQIEAAKKCREETESQLLEVTNEISGKEKTLSQVEDVLNVLAKELAFLEQYFSLPCPALCPRYIPTPIEVTRTIFRLTSCPACNLGFHCFNFVPTSCGHAYHPPCILPLLAKAHTEHPTCLACGERLHPDWIETWGFRVNAEHKVEVEAALGLKKQKLAFEEGLRELYHNDPARALERREYLKKQQQLVTMVYTEISQPPTPTSAPASSNVQQLKPVKIEGEKDNVGKSAGPKKRKGPKHSDDTVLPPPHKVKTRHATKSEIGTGIDSPSESRTITLKSYKAINTPPTDANTRRKMSLDKVRLMYSQTGNTPCEA
ncbi:hypothetical protein R1sor_026913 [Riccia sorocarpa]|uniref:RING-type domain-containing protein n=1 Tax=Riccia sorocarpa TaxID=122646 RepID=A0ABD3GCS8_9MARC